MQLSRWLQLWQTSCQWAGGILDVVQNMQEFPPLPMLRGQSQFREECWRPPRWLLWLLLCNCTDSGMWLGRMRCIFHHLKGGSNQPQSLASSTWAFESQCFISEHKLLDRVSLLPKVVFRGKRVRGERGEAGPGVYIWNAYEVDFCLSTLKAAETAAIINFSRFLTRLDFILDLIKVLLSKFRINARHLGTFLIYKSSFESHEKLQLFKQPEFP